MLLALSTMTYVILTVIVCLFQLALTMGAPWGHMAMGGKYPGKFPVKMRVGAVIQLLFLAFLALVIMSKSGFYWPDLYNQFPFLIWIVVGISGISAILNIITPSKWERAIWGPVGVLLFASSLIVALS